MSKTVQDRRIVSIKVAYEVICILANGDVAHDCECPLPTPNHPVLCIFTVIYSFVAGAPGDFKFGIIIVNYSKSHPADEKLPMNGACLVSCE